MFRVNAQAYLIEAGNVRHEHEFKVWRDVKLPAGKILIPGVVNHASDLVEHPELVADRIITFAEIVGQENVIAGTDCGLDGRVHPQIAWAKLRAPCATAPRSRARTCGVEFKATVRDERNEEAAFQAQKRTFKLSSDVFYVIFRHEILKFCWSDPAIND